MTEPFWENWTYRRNGVACNMEFFSNSFDHAERTLKYAPEHMGISCSLDVAIVPCDGGYIATIYAPLWFAYHLGLKESET